ncbi:MAG: transglycosylase domain-containing protein [Stackebrandtia sp.]
MSDYGSRDYRDYGDEPSSGGRYRDYGRSDRERDSGYGDGYGRGGDRGYGDRYDDDYEPPRSRFDGGGPTRGTASVGSARVGGSSYADDEPTTSGRARVPGSDPTGPGRATGSARVGGKRRAGAKALSGEDAKGLDKQKKKKRRRKIYIALGCVIAIFIGVGVVVGTLFYQRTLLPNEVGAEMEQSSTIMYAGGDKEMGKIGNEFSNRKEIELKDMENKEDLIWALLSAEDRGFYDHPGVDLKGVMSALWNNVTGGDTRGASTLTMQYVGTVNQMRDDQSYMRKANEAVMAMKMDDEFSKEQIIEFYMNLMYIGRGAYGIGTAAEIWFEKPVEELNASEAAVLFAQVKDPGCVYDPRDPCGLGEDVVKSELEGRWQYIMDGMLELGKISQKEYDAFMEEGVPETSKTLESPGDVGADDPTGFVSHRRVLDEVKERAGLTPTQLRTGGYKITTTIDPKLQKALKDVASTKTEDGGYYMSTRAAENLRAGMVVVEPGTGKVLGYYGGDDGTGDDKANTPVAPGSSFKMFTMLAALDEGIALDSKWDGSSPREFTERRGEDGDPNPLYNSGEGDGTSVKSITLEQAMVQSLNTPMYAIAADIGAKKIVQMAADMGITEMQIPGVEGEEGHIDLTDQEQIDAGTDREPADNEVAFGQYPVTVFDMAVANATMAAGGDYHEPHFVESITDKHGNEVPLDEIESGQAFSDPEIAGDAHAVLSQIHPDEYGNGFMAGGQQQPSAGKTGTWERVCPEDNPECDENSAVWYGGYTPHLAGATWVGDKKDINGSVVDEYGSPAYGAGPSGTVWTEFMRRAYEEKDYEYEAFPPRVNGGDKTRGDAAQDSTDDECDKPENEDKPECQDDGDIGECKEGDPYYPYCDDPDKYCEMNPTDPLCEGDGGGEDGECDWLDPDDPDCDDTEPESDEERGRNTSSPGTYSSPDDDRRTEYAVRRPEDHPMTV